MNSATPDNFSGDNNFQMWLSQIIKIELNENLRTFYKTEFNLYLKVYSDLQDIHLHMINSHIVGTSKHYEMFFSKARIQYQS